MGRRTRFFRAAQPAGARLDVDVDRQAVAARRQLQGKLADVGRTRLLPLPALGIEALEEVKIARDATAKKSREYSRLLVRRDVSDGSRLLDEGDWFGALVWFNFLGR